ncbi:spore coat protein YsxE [Heyndrickxia acidiproducens]|jgi:spore coat protein YsxE|uniref:spore coat protein YsxE n=1 Tax=Heyndrickxia acidiproducens TaxID=1121084 RepID=UPI000363E481|nr:spore coat protein YsxE [Heyndrickxia acidiproducens]
MLNHLSQQDMKDLLKAYGLQANYMERYGKAYKIYADQGMFALKRISPQAGMDFIRQVQFLYQRGYNRIIPVYPALDGRYGVLYNGGLYYLMPWLPNEEKEDRGEKHQKMFRELARLHGLSAKEVTISKEKRQEHYDETAGSWDRQQEFLAEFLERCEKQVYMSPFELLYCTFYNEISQALGFAKKQLESWLEQSKETEKARTVIAHGKISTEHFLYDERGLGYFANFEQSRIAAPFYDLLPFLSRTLHTYPKRFDECVDWVRTYFSYFPLHEDEKHLFFSYLSHPGPIIQVVEDYYTGQKRHEVRSVAKLQEKYWLLKNTEYVVMQLTKGPEPASSD